jgi:hypothetical protein
MTTTAHTFPAQSKDFTAADKAVLFKMYDAWDKSDAAFIESIGKVPGIQTLKAWRSTHSPDGSNMFDRAFKFKAGKTTMKAPVAPTPPTLAGMRAEMERQQQLLAKQKADYLTLLESEVKRLRSDLEKAETELQEYADGLLGEITGRKAV